METAMECDCDAAATAAAEMIVGSVSTDSSRVETTPSALPPPEKKPKLSPINVLLLKATGVAPCIESPSTSADTTPKRSFISSGSSSSSDSKAPTRPLPKKKVSSVPWFGPGWDCDSEDESDSEEVKQFLREEAEYNTDGLHEMTPREARKYAQMVNESDGFDVEEMDGCCNFSMIVPFGTINDIMMVELTKYANLALAEYNAKHHTDFKCAKIIKANWQAACMIRYYVTFEVKSDGVPDHDDHSPNQIFQASVMHHVVEDTVCLCRPKPNP